VKKCVRDIYFESVKIDVKPTKKGIKEIDENHPCYSMKYLQGMFIHYIQYKFTKGERYNTILGHRKTS